MSRVEGPLIAAAIATAWSCLMIMVVFWPRPPAPPTSVPVAPRPVQDGEPTVGYP